MSVRVTTRHPSRQPENSAGAKVRLEQSLKFEPAEARITYLHHRIEITLFGSDQRALAIHVDSAALEHELLLFPVGVEQFFAKVFGRGHG